MLTVVVVVVVVVAIECELLAVFIRIYGSIAMNMFSRKKKYIFWWQYISCTFMFHLKYLQSNRSQGAYFYGVQNFRCSLFHVKVIFCVAYRYVIDILNHF